MYLVIPPFRAAAATVLASIFPDRADDFWAQAQEASDSRVYGLIHYRFDCTVGLTLGKTWLPMPLYGQKPMDRGFKIYT